MVGGIMKTALLILALAIASFGQSDLTPGVVVSVNSTQRVHGSKGDIHTATVAVFDIQIGSVVYSVMPDNFFGGHDPTLHLDDKVSVRIDGKRLYATFPDGKVHKFKIVGERKPS